MSAAGSGREVHGLALLTLLSFIASFLAARTFTTLYPTTVVVTGGIHFHHFWYGLAMIVGAGWLSIVSNHPQFDRVYAIVFGLGAGLVGDEVGLLLTLGNYQSGLTYVFFVSILAFSGIAYLFIRFHEQLKKGVLSLGVGERLVHLGVFVAGLSAVALAFDHIDIGLVILSAGLVLAAAGWAVRGTKRNF